MKGILGLALVLSAASVSAQVTAGDLILDCGTAGILEGIGGFTVVKMPSGQVVRSTGGEVRTFPDGVKMSAVPYSDGSVLYTKATPPAGFFFQAAGAPMVKCEIP